jgi:hypothetical protein
MSVAVTRTEPQHDCNCTGRRETRNLTKWALNRIFRGTPCEHMQRATLMHRSAPRQLGQYALSALTAPTTVNIKILISSQNDQ